MNDSDNPQDRRNKPVETLHDGALKLAIFRNEHEKGDTYAMVPGRLYTGKDGAIRETASLSGSEALRMAHLLTKGHDKVAELRAQRQMRDPAKDRDIERDF